MNTSEVNEVKRIRSAEYCFGNDRIRMLRELRHAIAHNGGRETPELKVKHEIHVVDGYLQFMPHHLMMDVEMITPENAKQYYFPDSVY